MKTNLLELPAVAGSRRTVRNILAAFTAACLFTQFPGNAPAQDAPAAPEVDTAAAPAEVIDPVLLEIEREKARVELQEDRNKLWIAWIMPFAGMGFTLALLSIIFGYSRRADQNRHETIRRYLEKGEEVPERLLVDPDNPRAGKPLSDRRKGVIWTALGIGIGSFLLISSEGSVRVGAFGLIPLSIGIGYFVAARLDPQHAGAEK